MVNSILCKMKRLAFFSVSLRLFDFLKYETETGDFSQAKPKENPLNSRPRLSELQQRESNLSVAIIFLMFHCFPSTSIFETCLSSFVKN